MDFRLIIDPEAQREIDEAIDWYEKKQKGLGEEFFNYLNGYFKTLMQGNVYFPIKRKPFYRELPLKRFPFVIIYEHTYSEIYVYAVFNTAQDPKKKRK